MIRRQPGPYVLARVPRFITFASTLRMRATYAMALYDDPGATLDELREAMTTLEETERTARRVLGGAHPVTTGIEIALRDARAALAARETPSASA
jgi:hypothetical protein